MKAKLSGLEPNNYRLMIGSNEQTSARYFHGVIDEVAIWRRALSAAAAVLFKTKADMTGADDQQGASVGYDFDAVLPMSRLRMRARRTRRCCPGRGARAAGRAAPPG